MDIDKPRELLKQCIIKPFDNQEGTIIAIKHDRFGSEFLVRYFQHGMVINNWFFDSEIELKKEKIKQDVKFFKEY